MRPSDPAPPPTLDPGSGTGARFRETGRFCCRREGRAYVGLPPGRDGELRTFEELPDVLDVTQAEGDADDDDALTAEDLTDDEIVELEQEDDPGDGRDVDDRRPEVFDGE